MVTESSCVKNVIERARRMKEVAAVVGSGFKFILDVERDGKLLATALCTSRDQIVAAARCAILGFSADRVVLVCDTYATTPRFRAEDYRPDQSLVALFEAGRFDLVVEALMVYWVDRSGGQWALSLPYSLREDGSFDWSGDEPEIFAGQDLGGGIPAAIRTVMDAPRLEGVLPDSVRGSMSATEVRRQLDMATATMMADIALVVMVRRALFW